MAQDVELLATDSTHALAAARLCNFPTGKAMLLPNHKAWLDTTVKRLLRDLPDPWVDLYGYASHLGDHAFNKRLSFDRCEAVRKHILTYGLKVSFPKELGVGDAQSTGTATDNSGAWRAVEINVFGAMPPPKPAPLPDTKVIEVTAKSFIALIGSKVGSIPGWTTTPSIPPLPPVPVPRQTLLEVLARATDAQFNEDPLTIAKDKHYRLFSSCQITVVWQNAKILSAVPSPLDTDVGKEGPLQPPPLIASAVTVSSTGGSLVNFSWTGKGRPHALAEPAFQEVLPRTSVFIWHVIDGQIDVSSGVPITTVTIRGSRFPSHRVFVDGTQISPPGVAQGPFSNLWVPDPTDTTKVK